MQLVHPLADLALPDLLLGHVEGRGDAIAAAGHRALIPSEDLRELITHLEHEVRRLDGRDGRLRDLDGLGARGVGLLLGDRAGVDHLIEDVEATLLGAVGVVSLRWVEDRGRLGQAGEERSLRERELGEVGLPEVRLGGGLHAVGLVPVVDLVEVELEDLLLGVGVRHLDREDALADLSLERDLVTNDPSFHELLRDGRRSAAPAATPGHVGEDRADDAQYIDARVRPEALVLGGDGRIDENLRDLVVADDLAVLLRELIEKLRAGPVVDLRRLSQGLLRQVLRGRKVNGEERERRTGAYQKERASRDDQSKEPRRQREAPTAERSAAPAPLRAICPAPERVVMRGFRMGDASMVPATERIL